MEVFDVKIENWEGLKTMKWKEESQDNRVVV